jgi:uncharacterized protein (TIGR02757 family)
MPRGSRLAPVLDAFLSRADVGAAVRSDPVEIVHEVPDPSDREVAALVAALLAFGNVRALKPRVRQVLGALGHRPARALAGLSAAELERRLAGFRYRWLEARDLAAVLAGAGALLAAHGSLERAFAAGLSTADEHVGPAIARFSEALRARSPGRHSRGISFLAPSPASGSACKRFCLFLRWVARPADGVDLGLWRGVSPAQLVIPLDTHVQRIATYIGLTRRKSPGFAMALDITRSLKQLCPEDPLRYDFAICHLGISGRCPRRRDPAICVECDLDEICTLPRRERRANPP